MWHQGGEESDKRSFYFWVELRFKVKNLLKGGSPAPPNTQPNQILVQRCAHLQQLFSTLLLSQTWLRDVGAIGSYCCPSKPMSRKLGVEPSQAVCLNRHKQPSLGSSTYECPHGKQLPMRHSQWGRIQKHRWESKKGVIRAAQCKTIAQSR